MIPYFIFGRMMPMDAVMFFVYALVVFLLVTAFGGTMIGYYFQKKYEYEIKKLGLIHKAITDSSKTKKE